MRTYVKEYFYNNITEYLRLLIITITGIVIAIFCINNTNNSEKRIIKEITSERINNIKSSQNVNQKDVFTTSIHRNIKDFLVAACLSTTIIGLPISYFMIVKKAFSIGYTISAIFATQSIKTSIIFICSGMLFHNIIYLTSMFIVLVAGVNFVKNTLKKESDIKFEIIKYLFFVLIAILIVIISSLLEAYVSTFFLNLFKKYL